ncbi:MAG: hypothetical protein ACM3JD_06925 [Rudaea sp.]
MANKLLTDNLSAPLGGATAAKVDIYTGAGNLTIDRLTGGEQLLASGRLEYFEKQGPPDCETNSSNGEATLTLKGEDPGRAWFRFPWQACNGAHEWQIHLNPAVRSDITARSGGGNVKLDLAGMTVTRLAADTGAGNLDVVLPDNAANLGVIAKTGAGNVTVNVGSGMAGSNALDAHSGAGNVVVRLPRGLAARIHASSGMGKIIVDPGFTEIDRRIYQSPGYDAAVDKVDITAHSGAGNVSVDVR